jgi:hypothetical protein
MLHVAEDKFVPERPEVAGGWRRLSDNVELHNMYPSPNIVTVIKLRRMRRAEHVARMVGDEKCLHFLSENVQDLGVAGRILLE